MNLPTQQQRKPRLLAIDDSPLIHRLLKARLRSERLEIHCATSGEAGLEAARSLLPEIILLDVEMPDMDGFAVLAQLKAAGQTHDIPVILISASNSTPLKIRGFEMGAIDYVTKPFDVGELKARVRSAVRLRLLISMLAQRAQLDGLTGLWNRAHFDQRLIEEINAAQRHSEPLSLILCDIDGFKSLNDTYGHPFGDQVLEEFARILGGGRSGDIVCRYGGEEFAIIVPRADAGVATAAAQRLRHELMHHVWEAAEGLTVTASFGVTDVQLAAQPEARALIESADQAMYKAKHSGRNCVVTATPPATSLRISA